MPITAICPQHSVRTTPEPEHSRRCAYTPLWLRLQLLSSVSFDFLLKKTPGIRHAGQKVPFPPLNDHSQNIKLHPIISIQFPEAPPKVNNLFTF